MKIDLEDNLVFFNFLERARQILYKSKEEKQKFADMYEFKSFNDILDTIITQQEIAVSRDIIKPIKSEG